MQNASTLIKTMWNKLGRYYITEGLSFTEPFSGQLVRITQSRPIYPDKVKGVIYQGFKDKIGDNLFGKQELKYNKLPKILTFYFPLELEKRSLVFTRNDRSKILWFVDVEVFVNDEVENQAENKIDNLLINFQADLNNLIFNFQRGVAMKKDLIPKFKSVNVRDGYEAQLLVPANPRRAILVIRGGKSPMYLYTNELVDEDTTQPATLLEEVNKGEDYYLPSSSDGIYKGEIWVKTTKKTEITWTEYSDPDENL